VRKEGTTERRDVPPIGGQARSRRPGGHPPERDPCSCAFSAGTPATNFSSWANFGACPQDVMPAFCSSDDTLSQRFPWVNRGCRSTAPTLDDCGDSVDIRLLRSSRPYMSLPLSIDMGTTVTAKDYEPRKKQFCFTCYFPGGWTLRRPVMILSPEGVAHRGSRDTSETTYCGRDARGDGWWHRPSAPTTLLDEAS
jgi:hypothetical protein